MHAVPGRLHDKWLYDLPLKLRSLVRRRLLQDSDDCLHSRPTCFLHWLLGVRRRKDERRRYVKLYRLFTWHLLSLGRRILLKLRART